MNKWQSNRAWFFVLPVVVLVAFNAVIPLIAVVNWSLQSSMMGKSVGEGLNHYTNVLGDASVGWAFLRQVVYSLIVLAIEIPLGIAISLLLPARGLRSSLALVAIAVPLLIPFSVVGYSWRLFADPQKGMLGYLLNGCGWNFNCTAHVFDSWFTIVLMDVWHWTPLVALLCFAGLRAIPGAYYQAAHIDGASNWAIFRYIQLPKLKSVLIIAVLLRFMDSFMIFTEPFILNSGGPGSSTTMLSLHLFNEGYRNPTSGEAAAYSILYLIFVLLFSYVLYTVMMRSGKEATES